MTSLRRLRFAFWLLRDLASKYTRSLLLGFLAGFVMLGRIGLFSNLQPEFVYRWLPWISFVVFLLRSVGDFKYSGLFKKVKFTTFAFWDNWLVIPLCAINSMASLIVAMSPFPQV